MTAEPLRDSDDLAGYPSAPTPTNWWTDPNAKLGPRGKAWFYAVCAAALIASIIGIRANNAAHPTTGPGFYSVSTTDALYLGQLDQSGFPYGDAATVIKVGNLVGDMYDQGWTSEQLRQEFQLADLQLGSPYTQAQWRTFVDISLNSYATRHGAPY
jgi:hypothetical protein